MEKSYYEILGVNTDAAEGDIKSAFRSLARKWHPDVAGNTKDVEMKFKEITEAYATLSNSVKRKKYDALRGIFHRASESKTKESSKFENNNSNTSESNFKNSDKTSSNKSEADSVNSSKTQNSDSVNNKSSKRSESTSTFQNAWDAFMKKTKNSNKSHQTKHSSSKSDGSDITSEITISVMEALQGTTRTVNILHLEPCRKCHGRKFANGSICNTCKGVGEISVHKKLSIRIPEGVKHASKIRIAAEGNVGFNGGKNGDLYLIVNVDAESSIYKYDGLNILQTVPIEPFEAVLGGVVDVKTPEGKVAMKIMAGTVSGQKYRLANQGREKNNKKGDMIITVEIVVPKDLSKEEVVLYERLRQVCNRNIREVAND